MCLAGPTGRIAQECLVARLPDWLEDDLDSIRVHRLRRRYKRGAYRVVGRFGGYIPL
jgi:hypothetical protein